MSVRKNLSLHRNDIIQEAKSVQVLLSSFVTGETLQKASEGLKESDEMQLLNNKMNLPVLGSVNQFTLGCYMNDLLDKDIENGLDLFALLMQLFMVDNEYEGYKDYLSDIADAATELNKSKEFKDYAKAILLFEADTSPQAEAARAAMGSMSYKLVEWTTKGAA